MSIAWSVIEEEQVGKRIIEQGSQLLNEPTRENLQIYLNRITEEADSVIKMLTPSVDKYSSFFYNNDSWEKRRKRDYMDILENAILAPARVTALQLNNLHGLPEFALEIIDCLLRSIQKAPGYAEQFIGLLETDSTQLKSIIKEKKKETRRLLRGRSRSGGVFSDIQAIKDVQRIKSGGTAKLSISQITNIIINLPDAKRNLTGNEFDKVYSLYKELRKCNTKLDMDLEGYYETAVKIIIEFDKLAPYELYSGGNFSEFSFLMDEIRKIEG